jgi:hypothetical protein
MNDDSRLDCSDMPRNCLHLRGNTGETIDRFDDIDFDDFIENQWGGWHPWRKGNDRSLTPCVDYTMYWSDR